MIEKAAVRSRQQCLRAGFAAGLLAAGAMLSLAAIGVGSRLPSALSLLGRVEGPMPPAWFLIAIHFAYGAFAGALFAAQALRPGSVRGAVFGVALWLVALLVYAPMLGLGACAIRVPLLALAALPPHLVYGLLVGYLIAAPDPQPALPRRAARGEGRPRYGSSSPSLGADSSARAASFPPSRSPSRSSIR